MKVILYYTTTVNYVINPVQLQFQIDLSKVKVDIKEGSEDFNQCVGKVHLSKIFFAVVHDPNSRMFQEAPVTIIYLKASSQPIRSGKSRLPVLSTFKQSVLPPTTFGHILFDFHKKCALWLRVQPELRWKNLNPAHATMVKVFLPTRWGRSSYF